jgi:hypothetical protein
MQFKPGAVRVAVECGMGLVLVHVAIIYTDKSRYRSWVHGSFLFLAYSLTRVGPR